MTGEIFFFGFGGFETKSVPCDSDCAGFGVAADAGVCGAGVVGLACCGCGVGGGVAGAGVEPG